MNAERLEEIGRRVWEAFPERGSTYLRVIDEWEWWSGRLPASPECLACGRSNALNAAVFGDGMQLCAGCVALLRTFLVVDIEDRVLADLQRALAPEDFAEVLRLRAAARPPERSSVPCDKCESDDFPRWHFGRASLCIACIDDEAERLRGVAVSGRSPLETRLLGRL